MWYNKFEMQSVTIVRMNYSTLPYVCHENSFTWCGDLYSRVTLGMESMLFLLKVFEIYICFSWKRGQINVTDWHAQATCNLEFTFVSFLLLYEAIREGLLQIFRKQRAVNRVLIVDYRPRVVCVAADAPLVIMHNETFRYSDETVTVFEKVFAVNIYYKAYLSSEGNV